MRLVLRVSQSLPERWYSEIGYDATAGVEIVE